MESETYLSWFLTGLRIALGVIVMTRFGFLALVSFTITRELLALPITADPSRWYFNYGLLVLLLVFGMACYGFWVSIRHSRLMIRGV